MSLRDALISFKRKSIEAEFCGEQIELSEMSGLDFSEFVTLFDETDDPVKKAGYILSFTITADGKRMFKTEDWEEIAKAPFNELKRVATLASEVCGLKDVADKDAEKNS